MASKRMSAALSVLKTRNFSKMFLRARRALEFSHGLGLGCVKTLLLVIFAQD